MANLLIIGAGAVGRVVACKSIQYQDVFDKICLAGRTMEKCRQIGNEIGGPIDSAAVDANDTSAVIRLIRQQETDIVINVALPYQNMSIMTACLETGTHYIDTAAPEVPGEIWSDPEDQFWYGLQWDLHDRFVQKGIAGILGMGSDPGLVNVFCSYARDCLYDELQSIDIIDVNAGDHGRPFCTNFNPEINLREMQSPVHYWAGNAWHRVDPLSVGRVFNLPEIGPQAAYLMDHDELHSLYRNFPYVQQIRFWMGFSAKHIDYFTRLHQLGLLSINSIKVEMADGSTSVVVPLKLLKALLPDPGTLGEGYSGKVCLGILLQGIKNDKERSVFMYSHFDHEEAYRETGTQAISCLAGIPAVAAAVLLAQGQWRQSGVFNAEQLDHRPFMEILPKMGLPWYVLEVGPDFDQGPI